MSNNHEMEELLEIIKKNLKLTNMTNETIGLDASLEALGMDSTSALTIMLDLEDHFGVTFPESMFVEETFESPTSLWNAVKSLNSN